MAKEVHRCEECGRDDFKTASGLKSHQRMKHPPQVEGFVTAETRRAIAAADHLTDEHAGVIAVLLTLARTIDGMSERDSDAPLDNVTIPTYHRFSDALGLTPLAKVKLGPKEKQGGSKLAQLRGASQLRAVKGGRAS